MSNPDKIPGQSYRVRPEASAELDLLSALLRCGTGVECGRAVAAGLLREFGGLAGVSAADSSALTRAGLTGRAAAAIGRARSLAVAMARVEACRRPVLSSWAALVAYLRATMAYAPREQFRVLYLDKRNILMREEHLAHGTVDHAPVFNAGPGRVERAGGVPRIAETEAYIVSVLDCFLARVAGRTVRSRADCRPGRAS